jgi:hypothetical protein
MELFSEPASSYSALMPANFDAPKREFRPSPTREIFAYFKLTDKADSKSVRREVEGAAVNLGFMDEDIRHRMVEGAKWRHWWGRPVAR